jgi:hypothetical protein
LSLLGDENTFLQVWKINLILVKSAPKQCFSPKTVLPIENLAKSQKYPFFGQSLDLDLVLDFHRPSKILSDIWASKSLVMASQYKWIFIAVST